MTAADPYLRRDIGHSLAVSALACVLSGGLLYLHYLRRVWRVARHVSHEAKDGELVLVFGKRLRAGEPDAEFRQRLQRAHALATGGSRPLVLLGGGPPGASEAEAGLRALRAMGLPDSAPVRLEAASLDTLQNLRNARDLLGGGARSRVLLLSSRYHLARCALLARQLGFDPALCAAEERLSLRGATFPRLLTEAGYLCWLDVGTRWARLIGHRRMLARVS